MLKVSHLFPNAKLYLPVLLIGAVQVPLFYFTWPREHPAKRFAKAFDAATAFEVQKWEDITISPGARLNYAGSLFSQPAFVFDSEKGSNVFIPVKSEGGKLYYRIIPEAEFDDTRKKVDDESARTFLPRLLNVILLVVFFLIAPVTDFVGARRNRQKGTAASAASP